MREHSRDSGADRRSLDQGQVADRDAFHVGDGVERSGREYADLDAGIARPRPLRLSGNGHDQDRHGSHG